MSISFEPYEGSTNNIQNWIIQDQKSLFESLSVEFNKNNESLANGSADEGNVTPDSWKEIENIIPE